MTGIGASAMLSKEGGVDEDEGRRLTVALGKLTNRESHGLPVVPEARQRPLDPDHFAGKMLVGAVAVVTLAVAVSARSASLAVVAGEIIVGLLLVSDGWGLRRRAPLLSSENGTQAAVGWLGLLVAALVLRQVAALWS